MTFSAVRGSPGLVLACVLALAACSRGDAATSARPAANPWTHLDFPDSSESFHFAVVGDRAGWHRPGVFEQALERLEALGPAFILSVGDVVDTGDWGEDPALFTEEALEERWAELGAMVESLPMPFFYVGGNNELRTEAMEEVWLRRFGRTYYHFVYRDALFVVLNSEDPPGVGQGALGDAQLTWLREILAENADVRWTFLFLHKPMWQLPDHPDWAAVEEALGNRPRTAFAGHAHRYLRSEVGDHVYYRLATTGGASALAGAAEGQFDHVVWVSFTDQGPRISNIMLDGIRGDDPRAEVGG